MFGGQDILKIQSISLKDYMDKIILINMLFLLIKAYKNIC